MPGPRGGNTMSSGESVRPSRCTLAPLATQLASHPDYRLTAIKLLHTSVWALMASCIFALPFLAFAYQFRWAFILTLIIVGECVVLAVNGGRCPLTDWAARFTDDRADNFDIYLPNWVARHNKVIFGTLFAVNECMVLWLWQARP